MITDDLTRTPTFSKPFGAYILAAGWGSRMGYRPKANMEFGGSSVLHWEVAALRGAGICDVTLLVGPYAAELQSLAKKTGVSVVHVGGKSSDIEVTQLAAINAHVKHRPGTDMLILLGDLPLLRRFHIETLLEAWVHCPSGTGALVPRIKGTPGHPVVLSWRIVQAIHQNDHGQGIRSWMKRFPQEVCFLDVNDEAYTADIDTPSDAKKMHQCFKGIEPPQIAC